MRVRRLTIDKSRKGVVEVVGKDGWSKVELGGRVVLHEFGPYGIHFIGKDQRD
jgi:hypothetical protein